jgi:hypothetical protein
MFDDQSLAHSRTRRVLSILGVLVVVNVAGHLPWSGDSCTSWLASYFDRATSLDLYGDKAGAVAAYSEDLKRNPDHAEALQGRGKAYAALGSTILQSMTSTNRSSFNPTTGTRLVIGLASIWSSASSMPPSRISPALLNYFPTGRPGRNAGTPTWRMAISTPRSLTTRVQLSCSQIQPARPFSHAA